MVTVYPEFVSLKDWAGALVADNSSSYLPILTDENKWQEWGAVVAGTGVFSRKKVPPPFSIFKGTRKDNYKNWQEWAKKVYLIINTDPDNTQIEVLNI